MTSNVQKGRAKELLCQKELEKEGWHVIFRSHTCKRGPIFRANDMAGCIDIAAVQGKVWRFISCTHKGGEAIRYRALSDFARAHGSSELPYPMRFELWVWHRARWVGRRKNKSWREAHWERMAI